MYRYVKYFEYFVGYIRGVTTFFNILLSMVKKKDKNLSYYDKNTMPICVSQLMYEY